MWYRIKIEGSNFWSKSNASLILFYSYSIIVISHLNRRVLSQHSLSDYIKYHIHYPTIIRYDIYLPVDSKGDIKMRTLLYIMENLSKCNYYILLNKN